ncbi:prevent-host-death protein [Pelomonas sp. P7]|uniref:Prevent-host-death protein n=1 Tax=Pelomonas caseinilytica TaxID=2906763 RepID=A0ABS8XIL0_9BURK|nr:prevent-host-death protein [Pelomonas sp. P7]MCE4538409.1 prevent-host-death protein [Pelomonas sp. P7]
MSKQITTIPARQFARDLAGAKRAADMGPVLITDRGHPAYALLRIDDFYELGGSRQPSRSLLELMDGLPDTTGMDFEPPRLIDQPSAADLD